MEKIKIEIQELGEMIVQMYFDDKISEEDFNKLYAKRCEALALLSVVKSVKEKELLNFEGWYVSLGYYKTVAGNFVKDGIRYSESELYRKYEIEYLQTL